MYEEDRPPSANDEHEGEGSVSNARSGARIREPPAVFLVAEDNLRSRGAIEKLGAIENGRRRDMVAYTLSR